MPVLNIVHWYQFLLTRRKIRVEHKGCVITRYLTRGTPQGGVLSPVMWNVGFDEFLDMFPDNKRVNAIGYADDVCLVCIGRDPLVLVRLMQSAVNRAMDWANKVGLVFAPAKTEAMLVTNKNKIPIISPLGLGENQQAYNINGDTAASAIAKKLKSRRLLLMTNVEGVYDDQKKLISEIKPLDLENLIKWKVVQGGMIPKIQNCVDAVENGVRGVVILDGRKSHSILHEIFSDQGSGTLIRE